MDEGPSGNEGSVGASELASLYRRYHQRVWRTLACFGVPEPALEDALQDVFIVVHRRLGDPDAYRSVTGWIYAVARRVAMHHRRAHARHLRRVESAARQPLPEAPSGPEQHVADQQALVLLREFLRTLDEPQAAVFVLCEIEGLSAPEVAEIVKAKVATVYSRLRLARQRFETFRARAQPRESPS